MWFLNMSSTNRVVQAQKMARGWILKVEVHVCTTTLAKKKVAYHFGDYCKADLLLCFRIYICNMLCVFLFMKWLIIIFIIFCVVAINFPAAEFRKKHLSVNSKCIGI